MFREDYNRLNEQVKPSNNLIVTTIKKTEQIESNRRERKIPWRGAVIMFALIFFCLTLTIPAFADAVVQFFRPIQKSDEENGIRMEVVSAYIHENTAELYVTMQDLTDNRIDETIDLFDSYSISPSFEQMANCEFIDYDGRTHTATFLITIKGMKGEKIEGDKITFSVREFLSHKKGYQDMEIPIDFSTIKMHVATQEIVEPTGRGGAGIIRNESAEIIALKPQGNLPKSGLEEVRLTGVGYIDGKLHIQTAVTDKLTYDTHRYLYLKNQDGDIVHANENFSFMAQDEQSGRIDYQEEIFDILQSELSNYKLYGNFVISGMRTEGDWQITFPIEEFHSS